MRQNDKWLPMKTENNIELSMVAKENSKVFHML